MKRDVGREGKGKRKGEGRSERDIPPLFSLC